MIGVIGRMLVDRGRIGRSAIGRRLVGAISDLRRHLGQRFEGAQVGAGAVVPPGMRVPAGKLVLGTPARPTRELSEAQRAEIGEIAARYVRLKDDYIAALGRGW